MFTALEIQFIFRLPHILDNKNSDLRSIQLHKYEKIQANQIFRGNPDRWGDVLQGYGTVSR